MLSDNIKNLRKNKGFTQEELANKLNVVRHGPVIIGLNQCKPLILLGFS